MALVALAGVTAACTGNASRVSGPATTSNPSRLARSLPAPTPTPSWRIDRRFAPLGLPGSATHVRLLYGRPVDERDLLVDLDDGSRRVVHLATGYTNHQYRLWQASPLYGRFVQTGKRIVYGVAPKNGAADMRLYSQPADFSAPPRRLAYSGRYFASLRPGAVWVGGSSGRFVEVDAGTGTLLARSAPMPRHSTAVGQVADGFLVAAPEDGGAAERYDVRSTITGHLVRTLTRRASSYDGLLADDSSAIAWRAEGSCLHCRIHLTDVRSGADRLLALPPKSGGACVSGSFAPGHRRLALIFGCPRRRYQDGVVIVDLRTGRGRYLPRTHDSEYVGPSWSADGRWMFWSGQDDRSGYVTTLAYLVGSRSPMRFPRVPPTGLLAVLPAR